MLFRSLTNNKEAERAAKYRQLKNAFGGETLKDGELGYGDLFEAGSNVLSVFPSHDTEASTDTRGQAGCCNRY